MIAQMQIDPEFESVITPLSDDEFAQLESNIVADGEIFTPIFLWNGFIIDGHHRYKIIQKHPTIPYRTVDKDFANRYEALSWICNNQLGRRNLTDVQRTILIGRRYDAEKKAHGASDGFRGNIHTKLVSPQNEDLLESIEKTSERIASELGISKSSVERAGAFVKGLDAAEDVLPGITQEIVSGAIKPTKLEVIALANASPDEREEMAAELRLPKQERAIHHKKREQVRELRKSEGQADPDSGKITTSEILTMISMNIDTAITSMEVYLADYPDAFTDIMYKPQLECIIEKLENFIKKLRGEQNYV